MGHPVFVLPFNYGVGFFLENDAIRIHIIWFLSHNRIVLGKLNAIPAIPQTDSIFCGWQYTIQVANQLSWSGTSHQRFLQSDSEQKQVMFLSHGSFDPETTFNTTGNTFLTSTHSFDYCKNALSWLRGTWQEAMDLSTPDPTWSKPWPPHTLATCANPRRAAFTLVENLGIITGCMSRSRSILGQPFGRKMSNPNPGFTEHT